ncbi:MAG: hypothetical protein ACRCV7_01855 [Culicoidibacterales bacterium]
MKEIEIFKQRYIFAENVVIRIRIDPPDSKTQYPHKHLYDDKGNSLDTSGNIVDRKSPDDHIPLE